MFLSRKDRTLVRCRTALIRNNAPFIFEPRRFACAGTTHVYNSEPETVNRNRPVGRPAASERIDAISRAAVSRRKQNASFLPSLTIHRGEYLARTIRKQNTRCASPDKRIRACSSFLRLPCARVRMFSSGRLKYLAYFCWELIRAVIPASGCALKILSTNNPPAAHPSPSSLPYDAKGRAP